MSGLLMLILLLMACAGRSGCVSVLVAQSTMHSKELESAVLRQSEMLNAGPSSAMLHTPVYMVAFSRHHPTSICFGFEASDRNPIEISMFEIRTISMFLHHLREPISSHHEVDGVAVQAVL